MDGLETQDSIEYRQELKPVIELDCDSDYDEDRADTTYDPEGTLQGPHSTASVDSVSSVDGASSYTAPHDMVRGNDAAKSCMQI